MIDQFLENTIGLIERYSQIQGKSEEDLIEFLKKFDSKKRIYIVEHDGHINSDGFYNFIDALEFINSRIEDGTPIEKDSSISLIKYSKNGITHTWKIKEVFLR